MTFISGEIPAKIPAECKVCKHNDRTYIENLIASGAPLYQLNKDFGIAVRILRQHDQLHSTVQPSIDPAGLIREMRYVMELTQHISEKIINGHGKFMPEKWSLQLKAVETRMRSLAQYTSMTNAKKYFDPYMSLMRWQAVMRKISEALKDEPGALKKLNAIMTSEGPTGSKNVPMPLSKKEKHDMRVSGKPLVTEATRESESEDDDENLWGIPPGEEEIKH